jgi:hypothetical protein
VVRLGLLLGPDLLLVDNGGPIRAPTRAPDVLPVDNSGPTRALTRAPTRAPVLLHYDTQIFPVPIISRQCRYLRRRHRLRRWLRDHHSTLSDPSCMRKQDLLIIVADPLFDNDVVCVLLQTILSAFTPQSRTNVSLPNPTSTANYTHSTYPSSNISGGL